MARVPRICTRFLEAENVPVLPWPAYSPDMSPIEHVWDVLDQRVRQRVPVPSNIQQLRIAIEEGWDGMYTVHYFHLHMYSELQNSWDSDTLSRSDLSSFVMSLFSMVRV